MGQLQGPRCAMLCSSSWEHGDRLQALSQESDLRHRLGAEDNQHPRVGARGGVQTGRVQKAAKGGRRSPGEE